ncbi:MAG: hypothetical protein KAI17_10105 [Thiotrichaceae bacterium]|nr:hypothetical protein [Thiotrichaceae bacterium]
MLAGTACLAISGTTALKGMEGTCRFTGKFITLDDRLAGAPEVSNLALPG